MRIPRGRVFLVFGILLVVLDQVIKILVKTGMPIGGHFSVFGDWFQIYFIENAGMAFGMKFGGIVGKLSLTVFRMVLFVFLCWWITKLVRYGAGPYAGTCSPEYDGSSEASKISAAEGRALKQVPTGVLVGLTLITAGAFGNIIDCVLYGQIFSASDASTVASFGGSYAPLFCGRVVDMLYFPLFTIHWPSWVPLVGGGEFSFFDPIFNFADACVTVGALYLIIFQYKFFASLDKKK